MMKVRKDLKNLPTSAAGSEGDRERGEGQVTPAVPERVWPAHLRSEAGTSVPLCPRAILRREDKSSVSSCA